MDKISDIKLEIIGELIKGKRHVRELESILKIPKSTVSDKLKELHGQNIVDFEISGRNKEFFIKDTLVAENYIYMYERYKLDKLLDRYPELKFVISSIRDIVENELVVIFGSYAKFDAKKSSDIDIYVQTNSKNLKKNIEEINSKINVKIGKFDVQSVLGKEIIKNHVIIQNFEEFYKLIQK